ncbi:MAG TPA: SDR family NAD(P)-dependent oxidoreductase [Actinomycetota bacterium]|nr:SDR family NAD(P)-dependent oxidoreductase [Actinomycetota bacterium]
MAPSHRRRDRLNVSGAVVVVVGASSGIGEATALAFAQRGARVVVAARRTERLDAIVDRIERAGGRSLAATCDVTRPDQLETLRVLTEEAFGPTDVLVNSAGMRGGGDFASLDYDRIEEHVRLNVLGVLFGSRAFLPGMLARGKGHVVNVGSLAGRFATPGNAIYGATKHAVVAFSEATNYETEGRNVRVTSVNPGFVDTEGFPQRDLPDWAVLRMRSVTDAIVRVVRDDIAPEYSVPRWAGPLQLFRVLTPPLYRWGVKRVRRARHPDPSSR